MVSLAIADCPVCNPNLKPREKAERLSVSIPKYLAEYVRQISINENITISSIVEQALIHYKHTKES